MDLTTLFLIEFVIILWLFLMMLLPLAQIHALTRTDED